MRRRNRQRLFLFILLVSLFATAGIGYGMLFETAEIQESGYSQFLVHGLIGGLFLLGFELYLLPSAFMAPVRRQAFWVVLFVRFISLITSIMLTGFIGTWIMEGVVSPLASLSVGISLFIYVGGFMFLTGFVMQVLRIIGPRVLGNLILARYHHPREEKRIFLFLDIADSTKLSQELGDLGAQQLISRLFFELGNIVNEHGGEIHRYIGDAMVAIWPLSGNPERNREALECCAALMAAETPLRVLCQEKFGASTHWRIGMHGGPVVAGECGDLKQEIVYFGDVVNTAARIEAACKDYQAHCLVSDQMLNACSPADNLSINSLGPIPLKGRAETIAVSKLELASD